MRTRPSRSIILQRWKQVETELSRPGFVLLLKLVDVKQRESELRIAEIKQQEENVVSNLNAAWRYNENEPYYPAGKLESANSTGSRGIFGGGQVSSFGGTTGNQSTFGSPGQSTTFSGTSAFSKPAASSFGSSAFGTLPASAFSLESRGSNASNPTSTSAVTPLAFGGTNTNNAFGQSRTAFGLTVSAPSTFGSGTTATFGAKPSIFGTTSTLPSAPLSSGLSSQPVFGQTSSLGGSGLPPPPGIGFASKPTFGQTSALGALGGNSAPTFGQTNSLSSPFSGGLGRSLAGDSTTATFGAKSTFGSFGQGNQPNAFAQAGGMNQPNAFMQAANQPRTFTSTTAPAKANAFTDTNRFTVLGDNNAATDKDENMADDQPSPVQEKPPISETQPTSTINPPVPAPPPTLAAPISQQATSLIQPTPASTTSLSNAFGSLSSKTGRENQSQETVGTGPPKAASSGIPAQSAQSLTLPPSNLSKPTPQLPAADGKPVIDEMAAWMASEFVVGGVPENEPPLEVR